MTVRTAPARMLGRLRHPKTTVRWRLTVLYGGLFLVCGATLLAVTYTLVSHAAITRAPGNVFASTIGGTPRLQVEIANANHSIQLPAGQLPPGFNRVLASPAGRGTVRFVVSQQRIADLHQLEIESGIALAIMAIIAAVLGWAMAGRVLRPLRTITATARQISEVNLHERLSLPGPRDELRTLADTIDGLLGRLETAFEAQRRFVANASHELRTPLTAARALVEMVMTDPNATVASFRQACAHVLEENEHQEQLIDSLLALAQGERGLEKRERFDLSELVAETLPAFEPEAALAGVTLEAALDAAFVSGDRRLLARIVTNLLQNAIHHNLPDGRASIVVAGEATGAVLRIENSGPEVPADQIGRLLQPFQRLTADRIKTDDGFGLGLSIVAAIAGAHQAELDIRPGEHGGLRVEVRFPPAAGDDRPLGDRGFGEDGVTGSGSAAGDGSGVMRAGGLEVAGRD